MSIMAKLKAHPYLSILGLSALALGVDYAVEGEKSIASSLYRGLLGGGGPLGKGEAGRGAHGAAVPKGMPQGPGQVAAMTEYLPGYYPAFPAHYHPHWGHHYGVHEDLFRRGLGGHYGHGEGHGGHGERGRRG